MICKGIYIKTSFRWDKPEVFSCIPLGITAYIVTKVKGGKSPRLKHHIFTYNFSLYHSSQTNRLILMGLVSIAFFFQVLSLNHIEIENPLRKSGNMSAFLVLQFYWVAVYVIGVTIFFLKP